MFAEINKKFESPFKASKLFDEVDFVNAEKLFTEYGEETVFSLAGMWVNSKSKFGEHPVMMISTGEGDDSILYNLSCSQSMTDTVKSILSDDTLVEAINEGKAGIQVYKYTSKKYNRDCYGVKFVDM